MLWDGADDEWAVAAAQQAQWSAQEWQDEIKRLQHHISTLEQWKHHAEENMRQFQEDCLTWHGSSFMGFDQSGCFPAVQSLWPPAPSDEAPEPPQHPGGSPRKSSPASKRDAGMCPPPLFASLPAPIRVSLGPELVVPPSSGALLEQAALSPGAPLGSGGVRPLPPGLPPPGLVLARAASLSTASGVEAATERPALGPSGPPEAARGALRGNGAAASAVAGSGAQAEEAAPGVYVGPGEVAGLVCTRVEWRIEGLRGKLQASMGRPLVSPAFSARGLPNLRLMVLPDAREAVKSVRSRERKGLYASMVRKGPLHGALKLKADCLQLDTVLSFHLTVGAVRRGPFTYDFSECAIHGCDDFGIDWLKQVDDASGNLCVGVEILEAEERVGGPSRSSVDGSGPQKLYRPITRDPQDHLNSASQSSGHMLG